MWGSSNSQVTHRELLAACLLAYLPIPAYFMVMGYSLSDHGFYCGLVFYKY